MFATYCVAFCIIVAIFVISFVFSWLIGITTNDDIDENMGYSFGGYCRPGYCKKKSRGSERR